MNQPIATTETLISRLLLFGSPTIRRVRIYLECTPGYRRYASNNFRTMPILETVSARERLYRFARLRLFGSLPFLEITFCRRLQPFLGVRTTKQRIGWVDPKIMRIEATTFLVGVYQIFSQRYHSNKLNPASIEPFFLFLNQSFFFW